MKKVLVKIVGLSYSQSQAGSYVVVLQEKKGNRRIPIIIKTDDAQYIALKMESIQVGVSSRQDVIKSISDILSATISEIVIYDMVEGVFYCKLTLTDILDNEYQVNCGVSDAISLSLTYGCNLYVMKGVIESTGILLSDDGKIIDEPENNKNKEEGKKVSLDTLKNMLQSSIDEEDYELASKLRDKIESMELKKK